MKILSLDHLVLTVADLDVTSDFYCRVLGMEDVRFSSGGIERRALKFGEQKRVFSMIPGLEHAEFVRYGVMHKNTYIHSPSILTEHYESKARKGLFFAGQITGVEGYIESASSGMLAGIFAGHDILETTPPTFSADTACGALAKYVSGYVGADFQPMNVNFGIMNAINMRAPKRERKQAISKRALEEIAQITNGGIEK